MQGRYLVKIVPPFGYRIFRFQFARRHLIFTLALLVLAAAALGGFYIRTLRHAEASVGALRSLTRDQRERLEQIDAKASALDGQLRSLERQNAQIRSLMGRRERAPGAAAVGPAARPAAGGAESRRPSDDFAQVAARIERLRTASARAGNDVLGLRRLAMRLVNTRRLQDVARARMLAAIPSLNPAGSGVAIRSAYGWRLVPWPEFHQGVDLDADYGDPVRAAATGTVVTAAFDGGCGYKVDLDHGNGYHTWYCHLSRLDVRAGQVVNRGEEIALVGSTGASTGPHLHYQIMLDGAAVDPTPYLTGVPPRILASLH